VNRKICWFNWSLLGIYTRWKAGFERATSKDNPCYAMPAISKKQKMDMSLARAKWHHIINVTKFFVYLYLILKRQNFSPPTFLVHLPLCTWTVENFLFVCDPNSWPILIELGLASNCGTHWVTFYISRMWIGHMTYVYTIELEQFVSSDDKETYSYTYWVPLQETDTLAI